MTSSTPTARRRDVLAGLGFFAGIAVAAPALATITGQTDAEDAAWREFIDGMAFAHRNGRAAAERARKGGMNLSEFSGVILSVSGAPDEDLPILYFGDTQNGGQYFTVSPSEIGEYRPARSRQDTAFLFGKAVG